MAYGVSEGSTCVVREYGARQDHGFTLVEIMVACAVLGLATALAVPNFMEWQARSQLRHATSEVATQLTLARMSAMNRNRGVNVTVQNVGGSVMISAATTSDNAAVLNEAVQAKGIVVNESPVTVSFSSLGIRTSGGTGVQTIAVCNSKKQQYSVTVIPAGKVNWSTASGATPCS